MPTILARHYVNCAGEPNLFVPSGSRSHLKSVLCQLKFERLMRRGYLVREHRAIGAVSEGLKRDVGGFHRETNDFC